MDAPDHSDDPRGMEMIDAYIEHLRRSSDSKDTPEKRRGILERLHRELEFGVGQVSTGDLRRWLYRDQWSQNTRATYYRCIKSFYGWATDPDDPWIVGANPAAKLERVAQPPTVARACTDDQLRLILAEARQPIRLWALIAAYQGLRCCEISGLDREHVTERQLFVVRGKGGRPRAHDTDPDVWAAVRDLPPGPVARDPRTGERAEPHYITASSAYHFQEQLKIPVTLHKLRHWLGTTMQREYKDIRVTQESLGHASLTSTQIYTTATSEQLTAARSTLPRFGR